MSYDIYLRDRVTKETIQLPVKHIMTGGTYRASYDESTGTFSPEPITDAWLNITYNYGHYYYEVTEGDSRFAHEDVSAFYADGTQGHMRTEYGIRGIYGKTGAESIPMIKDMISRIEEKYKKDGEWITTQRTKRKYFDAKTRQELDFMRDILGKMSKDEYMIEDCIVELSEGPNENYWESTAANAIKPLYQLITMAELRPDGVWDGD